MYFINPTNQVYPWLRFDDPSSIVSLRIIVLHKRGLTLCITILKQIFFSLLIWYKPFDPIYNRCMVVRYMILCHNSFNQCPLLTFKLFSVFNNKKVLQSTCMKISLGQMPKSAGSKDMYAVKVLRYIAKLFLKRWY